MKDYILEAKRQLDTKYYQRLEDNPQESFKTSINNVINGLQHITDTTKETLLPSINDRVPQFYLLPKIHKTLKSRVTFRLPRKTNYFRLWRFN